MFSFVLKHSKQVFFTAALLLSVSSITLQASAQSTTTPTAKDSLNQALAFAGFDTTGIKFDMQSDAAYATDNANYKYHLNISSQSNGYVVAFSNDQTIMIKLSNAAILLYEVGQVRNIAK